MSSKAKTIIITGATGGVGKGIAIACGEAGWNVWIAARREFEGSQVAYEVDAAGGKGQFVFCDVGIPASVDNMLKQVTSGSHHIDGIVHNATSHLSPVPKRLHELTLEEMQSHIDVALGALHALASLGHQALKQTRGSFLTLTSEAGFEGKAYLPAYAAVKGAQRGFIKSLAREWGRDEIRVNAIAPLAMTPAMQRYFENEPVQSQQIIQRIPLGRLGDPVEDIGRAARFLLSDDARYITGHTLMVDGGSCPAI